MTTKKTTIMKTSNKVLLAGVIITIIGGTAMALWAKAAIKKHSLEGSGNIIEQIREVESFTGVDVSHGITVQLSQGTTAEVKVESDDNIIDHISTEVVDNVLKIRYKNMIISDAHTTVYVKAETLEKLRASAGSQLRGDDLVRANNLSLKTSSGSVIDLNLEADTLTCKMSSGSTGDLKGKSTFMELRMSSGSTLDAKDFQSVSCTVKNSSGSESVLNVSTTLNAKASSGSIISYKGNPENVSSKESSGGSINKID
jgi:hypothetical protein